MLRTIALAIGLSVLAFASTGCTALSNTEKGVGLGGLIGAGVGTAVGAASGNPRTGAVVGGLLGAGAGGLIGNDIDREEKHRATDEAAGRAYDRAQPARIDEIIRMAKNGQSERVIVNHIRQSRMRFALSADDLNDLKANGVPDAVIVEMQNTAEPSPVIVREPVYIRRGPPPVIFVEPYGYRRRW